MADTDLIKLYNKRILALTADIPHRERLDAPDASAQERSPLCGSTIVVDVVMDGEQVADLGMDVKACALGQASASLLGSFAVGATLEALEEKLRQLEAMLKGEGETPAFFEVLTPAIEFKNRHASILLPWRAVVAAIKQAGAANARPAAE